MKSLLAIWLGAMGMLATSCAVILGEDFQGYDVACARGEPTCSGGGAGMGTVVGGAGSIDRTGSQLGGDAGAGFGDSGTSAGAGGSVASGGSGGATGTPVDTSAECQPDATLLPECLLFSGGGEDYPAVAFSAATGVAMGSAEAWGGGFSLFASKRGSSTVVQNYTKNVEGTIWSSWFCFDAVPKPDRLAVASLLNGEAEVFVTTRCGALYRRASWPGAGWLPWQPVTAPSVGSAVSDAATSVSSTGTNYLFVADGGKIFARNRVGTDSYSPYGEWREISGLTGAVLLTAGLRSDGRQQVFSLDAQGTVRTAVQAMADDDSTFGAWVDFDSRELPAPLLDIEAPHGGPFPLEVFAVDSNGSLWQRTEDPETGGFLPWQAWNGPPPPSSLVSLSGAAVKLAAGTPLQLAGLSAGGAVYSIRRTGNVWFEWTQPQ
jgi:hypothetical protein